MGITSKAAFAIRYRYLESLLEQWCAFIDFETHEIPPLTMVQIYREIYDLDRYESMMDKGATMKGITEDQIQSARDYPIEQVVEFHRGVALAFCHADTRPSLTWYKAGNRATCFPCGKSFNALDVLIERDGFNFIDAVKQLCK
jgi:DNA primase